MADILILPCDICSHSKRSHDSIMCVDCQFSIARYDVSIFHEFKMDNLLYLERVEKQKNG